MTTDGVKVLQRFGILPLPNVGKRRTPGASAAKENA